MSAFEDAVSLLVEHGWVQEPNDPRTLLGPVDRLAGAFLWIDPEERVWFSPDGFIDTEIEDVSTINALVTELGWRIRCWRAKDGEVRDHGSNTKASLKAALGTAKL